MPKEFAGMTISDEVYNGAQIMGKELYQHCLHTVLDLIPKHEHNSPVELDNATTVRLAAVLSAMSRALAVTVNASDMPHDKAVEAFRRDLAITAPGLPFTEKDVVK